MAVNVIMTEDVRKYETKLVGPFTMRMIVCILVGLAYSWWALLLPLTIDYKVMIFAFLMVPAILAGFKKVGGAPLEVFIMRNIYTVFLTPPKRTVKRMDTLRQASLRYDKQMEEKKLRAMSSSKRKRYLAKKKKGVRYTMNPKYRVYR